MITIYLVIVLLFLILYILEGNKEKFNTTNGIIPPGTSVTNIFAPIFGKDWSSGNTYSYMGQNEENNLKESIINIINNYVGYRQSLIEEINDEFNSHSGNIIDSNGVVNRSFEDNILLIILPHF